MEPRLQYTWNTRRITELVLRIVPDSTVLLADPGPHGATTRPVVIYPAGLEMGRRPDEQPALVLRGVRFAPDPGHPDEMSIDYIEVVGDEFLSMDFTTEDPDIQEIYDQLTEALENDGARVESDLEAMVEERYRLIEEGVIRKGE